jgi:hypothetical protein
LPIGILQVNSLGDIDPAEYLSRLESAIRAMPDCTPETTVDVFLGDETRYEGMYSDSEMWEYDSLTDRLNGLAERVFAEMCSE